MDINHGPLRKLFLAQTKKVYKKGEVIQRTDSPNFFTMVDRGYIKRYFIHNDGSIGLQGIYGPGFIFPLTMAYDVLLGQAIYSGPETYYYEAMTDAELFTMTREELATNVKTDISLYRDLFIVSGRRLYSYINSAENQSLENAYQKVAHILLYFARTFGEKKGSSGVKIQLRLTHADIAATISITRETVSRYVMQLKKAGLIKIVNGNYIVVPNMKKLEAVAYGLS